MVLCVVISTILAVWSPDAVARMESSRENDKSIMALEWGRNAKNTSLNLGLACLADSRSRTCPSSSPTATRLFAKTCQPVIPSIAVPFTYYYNLRRRMVCCEPNSLHLCRNAYPLADYGTF